jgi:lipoate-protein ligase A
MFDYEYWGNRKFSGKINMALEELMLNKAAETKKAIIRFFSFPKDTIVLGYAQATDVLKTREIEVVRRATGGSHVQVGNNIIAYSFAVPRDGSFTNFEDMRKYYAEHIVNAFLSLGIDNVEADNEASTINIDGKVVASHAIIWGVNSALMHGLIIIDPYDADKLAKRVYLGTRVIGGKVYSEYNAIKNIPAISKILPELAENSNNRIESINKILAEVILNQVTNGKYENKVIDDKVIAESYYLLERRYGNIRWTNKHKPVFTEDEIEAIPGEELNGRLKKGLGYCLYLQVKDKDFKRMALPEIV